MFYKVGVLRNKIKQTYLYQSSLLLKIGQVILVDFNNKNSIGVIFSIESHTDYIGTIKDISDYFNYFIPNQYIKFIQFVAEYNIIPIGSALKLIIPFSVSNIKKQHKELQEITISNNEVCLNKEQQQAVNNIKTDRFFPVLLHGVTGSGKTEVYLEIIKQLISEQVINKQLDNKGATTNEKKQILILVPEISLSNNLAKKVAERCSSKCFCSRVFIWHNSISINNKIAIWKKAINGEPIIIVGARSALFIPFSNLKLIVVDEEHDATFKQNDKQIYHARDMAVYLASLLNIPIILSSATPSVESYANAISGKYKYIKLETRYHCKALLPDINIQDLKGNNNIFTDGTVDTINKYLDNNQQILIFVNRRGYAPKKLCSKCGWKITCPACDTWLCFHSISDKLICHYCGYEKNNINKCQQCGNEYLSNIGIGIEKVYTECCKLFPQAKIEMVSSENMKTPTEIENILKEIEKSDIILGTQILAKGHNFNKVNLVVITNIDYMLYNNDFRALEHTFQLLYQVSGRAGRIGNTKAQVILQTYDSNNQLFKLFQINNQQLFYSQEIKNRKMTFMPPYGYIATMEVKSNIEEKAKQYANNVIKYIPKMEEIKIIGPIKPTLYKVNYKYRFRILLISKYPLQKILKEITNCSIPIKIDINPYEW